jgi:hypothetical protein
VYYERIQKQIYHAIKKSSQRPYSRSVSVSNKKKRYHGTCRHTASLRHMEKLNLVKNHGNRQHQRYINQASGSQLNPPEIQPRINIRSPIRAKHAAGCISSSFIKTLLSGNSTINHENYTSGSTIFWSPNFSPIPRHLKLSAYIPVNPLCTRDLLIQYILSCFGWIKQQAKRL